MDDLVKAVEYIQKYAEAVKNGVKNFAEALPIYARQHIETTAKRKLDSSRKDYIDALSVKMENYILYIELDPSNWLANAVESGAAPFDMRPGLLDAKNTKVSKKGFRYTRVPLGKDPNSTGPKGTKKGQDIQDRIKEALLKPKFEKMGVKSMRDGTIVQSQKVVHKDPKIQGLYRTRKFSSPSEFHSGKKPKWQYVMFRTISNNPNSESFKGWQHPGIKPHRIFQDTETWLNQAVDILLEGFIESEINKIG